MTDPHEQLRERIAQSLAYFDTKAPDYKSSDRIMAIIEPELALLREEIDEQCRLSGIGGSREAKLLAELAAVTRERNEARAKLERAEAALLKYGRHDRGCENAFSNTGGETGCMCGFDRALSPTPPQADSGEAK